MQIDLMKKLPVREHIRNMKAILHVIAEIDRGYFWGTSVVHLINVLVPYMELLLSAYILDAITAGSSFEEMFLRTAIMVGGIFVLHFLASTVWNRMEIRREYIFHIYECSREEKMLHMDFAKIDSPKIRELRERISRDLNWGAGINSVFWQFNGILYNCMDLVGAVFLGAPVIVLFIRTKNYGVWLLFLLVFAAIVIALRLNTFFTKKENRFLFMCNASMEDLEEEHREKESCYGLSFSLAYEGGFDYRNGKVVRLYDGYSLLERWTTGALRNKGSRARMQEGALGCAGNGGTTGMISGIMEGASYLMVVLIALSGGITVGNLIRFAGCLYKLLKGIYGLVLNVTDFALTCRKHVSTLEFLELNDEMYKGKIPVEKRSDNEYQIEFRNVSFRYPGSNQWALRNFSMKLRIGEKLAIVGMNGSGKTTMIKLLCRLYDPDEGEILLNGVDIRKFKQEEYSRLFSVVFQDYCLFPFQLGQNVAVNCKYDEKKVRKCLTDAGLGERIASWPEGLNTYLYKDYDNSGIEISGGEAQKIAIARAICKEAPFILLDEPTAALDPLAEHEIYTGFDKIIGTKTAIYISHRLSSCRFCEKIAVFHEGRLVQLGDHDTLVQDVTGKYYEMWNAQAQYYQ